MFVLNIRYTSIYMYILYIFKCDLNKYLTFISKAFSIKLEYYLYLNYFHKTLHSVKLDESKTR